MIQWAFFKVTTVDDFFRWDYVQVDDITVPLLSTKWPTVVSDADRVPLWMMPQGMGSIT